MKPARVGKFTGGKYAVFVLDHTKEEVSEFGSNFFLSLKKKLSITKKPIVERYTSQTIDNNLCEY
ncbi:hypothetical protein M3197_16230 [Sporosarcina aquimarina]|uniref:hypothetical protein n=1 Tax=Sporosarcina aquimarina TaxID=114975 RepID=UPI00203D333A|nr:hypothetical protein [Sporosarcina aquimarina]MCM3758987.1 hypothetical protein [Sporosarcina aquimarina]